MPSNGRTTGYRFTITPASGANAIDRVQIREDQSQGQFIRQFKLSATVNVSSAAARSVGSGNNDGSEGKNTVQVLCPTRASSIGNKYICVLPALVRIASLTLEVTEAVGGIPSIKQFSAFKCSDLAARIDVRVRTD
jgi:hypothetical protein